MKHLMLTFSVFMYLQTTAQVGIGTTSPHASAQLDITSTSKGMLMPRMTKTQRNAIGSPAIGLLVYQTDDTTGLYLYSGSAWQWLSVPNNNVNEYGDLKQSVKSSDHSGWVKLDGRDLTSLTSTQQTVAGNLGYSGNLPNANDAFIAQKASGTAGTVEGSNSKTIAQANLPNYNMSTTTTTNGSHSHDMDMTFHSTTGDGFGVGRIQTTDRGASVSHNPSEFTIKFAGSHSHAVTVNSGGSGTALDITPKTLIANTFVYLGE